jgi:hypothetical protein
MMIISQNVPDIAAFVAQKSFALLEIAPLPPGNRKTAGGKNEPESDALPSKTTRHGRPVFAHLTNPRTVKSRIYFHVISGRYCVTE